jgi:hypothetical protein
MDINIEKMKINILNSIVYKTFLLITVLFLFMTACTKTPLNLPEMEDIETATIREYCNSIPISREIVLDKDGFLESLIGWSRTFVKVGKKSVNNTPTAEKCFQIRLKLVTGEVRTLYLYAKGNRRTTYGDYKEYIEEPHLAIYKCKLPRRRAGLYQYFTSDSFVDKYQYLYITFYDAFGDAFRTKNYSILPEYNGTGKAIWLDFSHQNKNNPLNWPNRYIPKTREAERAEDVRYIVEYYDNAVKDGYWYVPSTGQRLGDSYKTNEIIVIYDLVNSKITNIHASYAKSILEEYFSTIE